MRGSPLGCVVGILACFPFGLSGVGIYGWIRWSSLPIEKRPEKMLSIWISCTAGGLVLGLALIWLAISILRRTDWKSYDPDKPFSQM